MSKRKKAVLAVGLVLAVLLIGAIIFYMHFIMNAGQTIETLQKLVAGNGYEITADCAMTFEPSDQLSNRSCSGTSKHRFTYSKIYRNR